MKPEIARAAKLIWDYHHLSHTLTKSDCALVLGSSDVRTAKRGAEVFLSGLAPMLVISGKLGSVSQARFNQSEASLFADIIAGQGVPRERMLIEDKSTNTGENLRFSLELLEKHGIHGRSFIVVQKPYMERRTFATAKKLFPDREFLITSPNIAFEDYPNEQISQDLMINIMVGDLQRIMEYPAKGFQIQMEVPVEIKAAYAFLVEAGYDKHLIN